jgi:hypothetical protein
MSILDITQSPKAILLQKYNAFTGIQIRENHVELGAIEELDTEGNTKVEFLPTLAAPFLNKFHLKYKRMNVSDIFGAPYTFVESQNYATLYELLSNINTELGINLTTDDVEDAPINYPAGEKPNVVVKTKATSYLFYGEATVSLDEDHQGTQPPFSNSAIYVSHGPINQNTIDCYGVDGSRAVNYKFLNNVENIIRCDIDSIHSTEKDILVIVGEFELVSTNLSFINPAVIYTTLTMDRTGRLLSARETKSLLQIAEQGDIARDALLDFYYVCGINPMTVPPEDSNDKGVYRLFANGTVDRSFNVANFPEDVVAIECSENYLYMISVTSGSIYRIYRFYKDGAVDNDFSTVTFSSSYIDTDGVSMKVNTDYLGQDRLHIFAPDDIYSGSQPIVFDAETVHVEPIPGGMFSPFFTVELNGKVVTASGARAGLHNPSFLLSASFSAQLLDAAGRPWFFTTNSLNLFNTNRINTVAVQHDGSFTLGIQESDTPSSISVFEVYQNSARSEVVMRIYSLDGISSVHLFGPMFEYLGPLVNYPINETIQGIAIVRR